MILPSMPQERFIDAIRQCDVLLDTIGWSGGKSTLDSLAHDAPIVTLPGHFMRGRHTAAILTRMGVTETVAASVDGYVDIAVQLACDRGWRESLRNRMAAGRHRVFGDRGCIEALEDFLLDAVERSGSEPRPRVAAGRDEQEIAPPAPLSSKRRGRSAGVQGRACG